jgi:RNA polymerase sigma-70 factor, ECF subfamily
MDRELTQKESFEGHYRENYPKVYRLAFGLTANQHDAEEITQEAFSRAFQAFESFRGESSFFTWIYRIALNVSRGYLKQKAKMTVQTLTEDLGYRIEEILDEKPENNPETAYLAREVRVKCLHSLTECLTGDQRRVFCLAITLGLPHKLVAEILQCSVGSVKTTLHRARRKWLGYMENHCSLIKEGNPCRCEQWIRFALQKGWITKSEKPSSAPALNMPGLLEMNRLKAMTEMYRTLQSEATDQALRDRIKQGIHDKEWSLLS